MNTFALLSWAEIISALLSALANGWAAWLWHQSSTTEFPPYAEPTASISDAPELHIMAVDVRQIDLQSDLAWSGRLNARAAKAAGMAATLSALTVLLGLIKIA